MAFLEHVYPDHLQRLTEPPSWVKEMFDRVISDTNAGFVLATQGPQSLENDFLLYDFWQRGDDLSFIESCNRRNLDAHV
jgi:hypothetical protein